LAVLDRALQQSAGGRLRREAQVLAALGARLQAANPSARLSRGRERLGITSHRLDVAGRSGVERRTRRLSAVALRLTPAVAAAVAHCRGRFDLLEAKLDGRNPTAILQRGYAIVTQGGRFLRDPLTAEPGSAIAAQLAGGTVVARVEAAYRDGGHESGHL
jgi:exodeoxyribonuclease VII large subunit